MGYQDRVAARHEREKTDQMTIGSNRIRERGAQTRQTDMQKLLFNANNQTANSRANTNAFRERTAMSGRRGSATTATPGLTFDQRLKAQKYNDSLMYTDYDDGKGSVLHPGIALLNKIKKSKDPNAAFAKLDDKDLALVNQGREILGRMMPTESNAGPMGRVGSQPGAMGRVGGAGAYGAPTGGGFGARGRMSDRGSNLSNWSNPMDGIMRDGRYSPNKARRLAGERRTSYRQSMASQRSAYANRNAAYDKANPGMENIPSSMMEPGWSPGSRFYQAGNMGGEGIGGSGITLGSDGTYRDTGAAKTYRAENPSKVTNTKKSKVVNTVPWRGPRQILNNQYQTGAPASEQFVLATPPSGYTRFEDTPLYQQLNQPRGFGRQNFR